MKKFLITFFASLSVVYFASCDHTKSYAELLNSESQYTNSYLADQVVIGYEERDSTFNFDYGPDAPFYQLDEYGNIYMRVIEPGTKGNYAQYDQMIYFRYMRYPLQQYSNGSLGTGSGNAENLGEPNAMFRFQNFSTNNSIQWGEGLQMPLQYLPIDCKVDIVLKAKLGPYTEIQNVVPYLYSVRYFKSQI